MEKLEMYKMMFNNQGIDFGKYVYRCFIGIELGKTIFCSVQELDDFYTSMVGGVVYKLDKGKTPEYIEDFVPSVDDRNSLKGFRLIFDHLMFGCGQKTYDFDKWLEDNPESENWLNIIEEYMTLSTNFQNNPVQWYKEIHKKMVDNQFKTK